MLPEGFEFSQSSLQDYVDCPRRFQLRYVQSQLWPAVQAEPLLEYERHVERGILFHRLVERHQMGLGNELLESGIGDPILLEWWRSYLGFEFLHGLSGRRYPEFSLSAGVLGVRLVAKYDLLVVGPEGNVWIFDWKTYSRNPGLEWFKSRLQTRVYLYVLASVGRDFLGVDLSFDRLSLVYWVAGVPLEPVVLGYGVEQFVRDEEYLSGLVRELLVRDGEVWPLVDREVVCRFCEYRSLCVRGNVAGDWKDVFEESIGVLSDLGLVEGVGF